MGTQENSHNSPRISGELKQRIIFGMEDQGVEWFLDTRRGVLVTDLREGRDIPLPEWTGVQGFSLMHRFVDLLTPGELRRDLEEILSRGHGVFKKFKERLNQDPVSASAWSGFKFREMGEVVDLWAKDWEPFLTISGEETEDSPPSDLVLSDFSLVLDRGQQGPGEMLAAVNQWVQACPWGEPWARAQFLVPKGPGDVWAAAAGPGEEWVALAQARPLGENQPRPMAELLFWYTKPGYRRLGLGHLVLDHLLKYLDTQGIGPILSRPPETGGAGVSTLESLGFIRTGSFYLRESGVLN